MHDRQRTWYRENQIYILPTGRGILYLILVVVLVLTASTYDNNLIFILAFFMFALFFVAMLQTHYNLKGVHLRFLSANEAFEGDTLRCLIYLTQGLGRFKSALRVRSGSKLWRTSEEGCEDLMPHESLKPLQVTLVAWRRGIHPVPHLILETFFPLGLFRAWKMFRPSGEVVVYPKPSGERILLPMPFAHSVEELGLRTSPEGDFGELKRYREGESYHQIAWKHYARTGDLYSKVHWGEEQRFYSIPWDPQGSANLESCLSQMSLWVSQAAHEGATFTMELQEQKIPAGQGYEHASKCWRALASVRGAA